MFCKPFPTNAIVLVMINKYLKFVSLTLGGLWFVLEDINGKEGVGAWIKANASKVNLNLVKTFPLDID
jgi:hypothetical protein